MAPTLAQRLAEATRILSDVSDTPRLDAELLLAHALGATRSALLARLHEDRPAPEFESLVERRKAHEPVAHILGEWEFFSLPVYTQRPVLVPRPETEHLVEAVLAFIADRPARFLDLCTGTGCVAVAIAVSAPASCGVATDSNPAATALARRNVERHGLESRVQVYEGDLFDALTPEEAEFDAICANPPYVADAEWDTLAPDIRLHEDPRALKAGPDGLDAIRRIADGAPPWLRPGGLLALEIGDGQYEAVARLLESRGYGDIAFRKDLAGIRRIVTATRPTA